MTFYRLINFDSVYWLLHKKATIPEREALNKKIIAFKRKINEKHI